MQASSSNGPLASELEDLRKVLREKSGPELSSLLVDGNAYTTYLNSLPAYNQMNSIIEDLQKGNAELSRKNLAKESEIAQLQTQCRIIRGTELASAKEKFLELKAEQKHQLDLFSPLAMLQLLHDKAQENDAEAEELHNKLLRGKMDISEFLAEYRKLRLKFHTRVTTRIAALASLNPNSNTGPSSMKT